MKTIAADIVDRGWIAATAMSRADSQALMARMSEAQPQLLAYLMKVNEETFVAGERTLLIYLCVVTWSIMAGADPLRTVSDEEINRAAAKNLKMVEYLEDESEEECLRVTQLVLASYNQIHVLRAAMSAMTQQSRNGNAFSNESRGLAILHLKTLVDCLDQ